MTAKFSIFITIGIFCLAFLMSITSRADSFLTHSEIVNQLQSSDRSPANLDFSGLRGSVDLRENDSPVESQFGGTCSTFAVSSALENLAKAKGSSKLISERYLWSLYGVYDVNAAVDAASKNYLTEEQYWPIDKTDPTDGYLDHLSMKITRSVNHDADLSAALRGLDQNHPVVMAIQVPKSLLNCDATVDANSRGTRGQHVVAVVGYHLDQTVPGGGYLILKNSWGEECGDKGYHYYPFALCNRGDLYCYFVEVADVEVRN